MKTAILALALCTSSALGRQGAWEPYFAFGDMTHEPTVAVHLIHVFDGTTGKVIAITSENTHHDGCGYPALVTSWNARLWTPPAPNSSGPGSYETVPMCLNYLFCGGHCSLADGRKLFLGGTGMLASQQFPPATGVPRTNLFTPDVPMGSDHWNHAGTPPAMNRARYYPTGTTLPDGRVLVSSGADTNGMVVDTPEIYDPTPDAMHPNGTFTLIPSADRHQPDLYPYMYVLPDGNLVDAGPGETRMLDASTWTWAGAIAATGGPVRRARPRSDHAATARQPCMRRARSCGAVESLCSYPTTTGSPRRGSWT